MRDELVSVIVPVYNAERYLPQCIESIINQTYADFELVLVNDGSSDRSGVLCDEYARKDGRIQVVHTDNHGPASARNSGMAQSRGTHIFFLDADDYIEKDSLQVLIDASRKTNADVIVGDFNKIRTSQTAPIRAGIFNDAVVLKHPELIEYTRLYLKKPNRNELFSYSWGRLFKASIIRQHHLTFNPTLHSYEDVAFNYQYLMHADAVGYIDRVIYHHVIHDGYASTRMMTGNPERLFGYRQSLLEIETYLKHHGTSADIRREIGHAYIFLTVIQLVRTCSQLSISNRKHIYRIVSEIIKGSMMQESVPYYSPAKGESKILPFLIRFRLIWPILIVCKYKAHKRYKLMRGAK